jgi:hypothetical protein
MNPTQILDTLRAIHELFPEHLKHSARRALEAAYLRNVITEDEYLFLADIIRERN